MIKKTCHGGDGVVSCVNDQWEFRWVQRIRGYGVGCVFGSLPLQIIEPPIDTADLEYGSREQNR